MIKNNRALSRRDFFICQSSAPLPDRRLLGHDHLNKISDLLLAERELTDLPQRLHDFRLRRGGVGRRQAPEP